MCNFYFNIISAGFGGSPYLELTIVGNTTRMVDATSHISFALPAAGYLWAD